MDVTGDWLKKASVGEIRTEYQRIGLEAGRAADAIYETHGEAASSRVYDAGLAAQRRFALRVRAELLFRLPEVEVATPDERGWYLPLANGWRRKIDFRNLEDMIYSPLLGVALAERAAGAKFPSFDDDDGDA